MALFKHEKIGMRTNATHKCIACFRKVCLCVRLNKKAMSMNTLFYNDSFEVTWLLPLH
ncbi:hypothetical protein D051_6199 [Vibrio parahaemolyticus VPCR-2010]|nr:hypothetical protein D051_6199 [Vibrio parahaemolyticus VPCR-2010]